MRYCMHVKRFEPTNYPFDLISIVLTRNIRAVFVRFLDYRRHFTENQRLSKRPNCLNDNRSQCKSELTAHIFAVSRTFYGFIVWVCIQSLVIRLVYPLVVSVGYYTP